MTRHFLDVPGGSPIEFDDEGDHPEAACSSCGEAMDPEGRILHEAECPAARAAVARASQDITTDGAAEFASAARLLLAVEFGRQIAGSSPGRQSDLIRGFLAGYAQAERAALEIARAGIARLSSELDAWSGTEQR